VDSKRIRKKEKIVADIIKFPTKNFHSTPEMTAEEEQKMILLSNRRAADNVAEGLAIDILSVLQDQITNMQSAEFIADLAFLIEVIKSTLHREMNLHHPVQDIIAKVCKVQTTKNGEKVTHINYKDILNKVDKDQIDIIFEPE
jgi:hypothetical protein|tara:strand:+ start:386 stop:814 length:429 start_codon:yes stop_codon:yes gene_type:complete